jgi:hypothetical protein
MGVVMWVWPYSVVTLFVLCIAIRNEVWVWCGLVWGGVWPSVGGVWPSVGVV